VDLAHRFERYLPVAIQAVSGAPPCHRARRGRCRAAAERRAGCRRVAQEEGHFDPGTSATSIAGEIRDDEGVDYLMRAAARRSETARYALGVSVIGPAQGAAGAASQPAAAVEEGPFEQRLEC